MDQIPLRKNPSLPHISVISLDYQNENIENTNNIKHQSDNADDEFIHLVMKNMKK